MIVDPSIKFRFRESVRICNGLERAEVENFLNLLTGEVSLDHSREDKSILIMDFDAETDRVRFNRWLDFKYSDAA